ncbi:MAG TPA: PilZ domain-containing protein [Desulfobacteraceae bacterium]|nr:PilZ domain-containing protein [Desulfobacteraceae bacterium]
MAEVREKRRFPRRVVDYFVRFSCSRERDAKVKDFSQGGLRLVSTYGFPKGSQIGLWIPKGEEMLSVEGKIVHVRQIEEFHIAGLEFLSDDPSISKVINVLKGSTLENLRRDPRTPINSSISFYSSTRMGGGRILDLSAGGARLLCPKPVTVGDQLELFFIVRERPIITSGRVVRANKTDRAYELGIAFSDSYRAEIEYILKNLKVLGSKERRRYERYLCDYPAVYHQVEESWAHVLDISYGGMRIETRHEPEEGKEMELSIPLEGRYIISSALIKRVVKKGGCYEVGLSLEAISSKDMRELLLFFEQRQKRDKRRYERIPGKLPISFCHLRPAVGTLMDINAGGIRLRTVEDLDMQSEVEILFPLEGNSVFVKGTVKNKRRMRSFYELGISFTRIDDADRVRLLEFFKKRSVF